MFEKHMSVQNTCLHHHACPGDDYTCIVLGLCVLHPPFSWDTGAQPFRKAINTYKVNKLQVGVVHVSGAGPGRRDKNGGELFSYPIELKDILQLRH